MARMHWTSAVVTVAMTAYAGVVFAEGGLLAARKGYKTKLTSQEREEAEWVRPAAMFDLVEYPTALGPMKAYLSKPTAGDRRRPAIIWITGGFPPGGMNEAAWTPQDPNNDQSAKDYRLADMVMMYPAFRGGVGNPGFQEMMYGEVDDVLAALAYLAKLPYVDPERIYLGGHSTGATLALLAAASTDAFKAVIAFGPASDPVNYGADAMPFDANNEKERGLRAPIRHLSAIKSPTFVIEGVYGRYSALVAMKKVCRNKNVRFFGIKGANHFDLLTPLNRVIATQLSALDAGTQVALTEDVLQAAFDTHRVAQDEADDLEMIAYARRSGHALDTPQTVTHYLAARERAGLDAVKKELVRRRFEGRVERREDNNGRAFFVLRLSQRLTLGALDAVFEATRAVRTSALTNGVRYNGWSVTDK